jgi:nucleoside-diphosphate-sugar epimerase
VVWAGFDVSDTGVSDTGVSGRVHLIGATGRTGATLARRLTAEGRVVVPVVRSAARWRALEIAGTARVADLADVPALTHALADADCVVSTGYAVWTPNILRAAPRSARLVVTGTARRYGSLPDAAGQDARAAELSLIAAARDAVILHPTMIYGHEDDGTVRRLAALIRKAPILPLPLGGRTLVQPVHVDDLAACLAAAAARCWVGHDNPAVPVAGPEPLAYRTLVALVARAAGLRAPVIVPVPAWLARVSGRPALLRLLEDRCADTAAMRAVLGVSARSMEEGLKGMGLGG